MHQFYSATHEVISVNDDIATLNISDHAIDELGDLVFVELPEIGQSITAGDSIIVVESVKAASDVYAPVSGEIIAVNDEVSDDPAIINEKNADTGWLIKIKMNDTSQLQQLMNEQTYLQSLN